MDKNYTLSYRALDSEDELLGNRVNSFHQDKEGFIWIATQQGIARYDGHQFQWFTKINSNLRGLPDRNKFVEDDEGFLWSTLIDKIDVINPKTLEIQSLEEKIGNGLPFKGKIDQIKQAKNNYIFIKANNNQKWYRYHSSTGFQAVDFISKKSKLAYIIEDEIWMRHSENTLIAYHYKTGKKLKEVKVEENKKLHVFHNYALGKERFWSTSNKTLEIWELQNGNAKKIFSLKNDGEKPAFWEFVFYLPKSNLLVTNFDGIERGLSILDIKNQQLIPVKNSKDKNLTSMNVAWVNDQDMVWTRAKRRTLLLQIKETHFHHYSPLRSFRGMRVFDNHLFVNRFKIPLNQPDNIEERGDDGVILSVEPNLKNELWVSNRKSIAEIDVKANTVKQVIPSKLDKSCSFWTILKTQEGQWWAGDFNSGLYKTNLPQNDSLSLFNQFNEFEELRKMRITQLVENGKYIWACSPIGLYLIHKEKGVVRKYNSEAKEAFRLPTEHVHFLYKDPNNVYWLATSSEGLIRFEVNEDFEITDYKKYTIEEGLSSNVIYCIVEDDKERLWLSTLYGISCFDKKTGNIQVFNKGDGIHESEFNRISYAQAEDGRLFFGSLKGVTAFYPDEVIKTGEYNIPIYFTQIFSYKKKKNERTDQTRQVQQSKKIIMQPADRIFRLNIAMLDIFNADKIRYSYKIEGFFENYQPIDKNVIEIGSLPYGRYILKVRGQGADKRFSKQELTIPLIVVRPFYLRWWFITISALFLIGSIFQVISGVFGN